MEAVAPYVVTALAVSKEVFTALVVFGLTLLGFFKYSDWWYGQYVDWRIKMRNHRDRNNEDIARRVLHQHGVNNTT